VDFLCLEEETASSFPFLMVTCYVKNDALTDMPMGEPMAADSMQSTPEGMAQGLAVGAPPR